MKKLIFFITFLIFTRIGASMGMSATPVGIGNFFLGEPSITQSNLNQVLGLLVGADGQPGASGVSGANGLNGLNGLPGINGATGAQGIQGVPGPAGAPGTPGKNGGIGNVGIGSGEVTIGSCDENVNIGATQAFKSDHFDLSTVSVSNISGGCSGQRVTIHLPITTGGGGTVTCSAVLPKGLSGEANQITFNIDRATCPDLATTNFDMGSLGTNIGLEFTEIGAGA